MCGTACAPSTSTGTPCECAMSMSRLIGVTVPRAFDTCVSAANFVRSVKSFS